MMQTRYCTRTWWCTMKKQEENSFTWTFRKSKESQASSTTCSKGCNVIKIPNCWSMLWFYSWNVTDELKQSVCIKHYSYWSSWLRQARATAFSILFPLLKGRINLQGESLDFHLFKWVEKKKSLELWIPIETTSVRLMRILKSCQTHLHAQCLTVLVSIRHLIYQQVLWLNLYNLLLKILDGAKL